LRRYDPRIFEGEGIASSPAIGEHAILSLREHLLASTGHAFPDLEELRRGLGETRAAPLLERLGLCPLPARISEREDAVIEVPLSAIRRFLEDPREGWTRFVLGVRDDGALEDPLAREDEAFS